MTGFLLLLLAMGTAAMLAVMLLCRKWYPIPLWKVFVAAPVLTLTGVASVKLMFFLENGFKSFDGLSFFGAVFFIPVIFILTAWALRLPYGQLMDLCAPSVSTMLAIVKINCLVKGCCLGRMLYMTQDKEFVFFPSREVELVTAIVIATILILLMRKESRRGMIYPLFMILYGATRFVLNFFRDTQPFILGLAAGTFWAIISVLIGGAWLLVLKLRKRGETDPAHEGAVAP